jgi:tetratricopeptide (TPR) repeat protein
MIRITLLFFAGLFFAVNGSAQIYSQLYSGKQEMFLEAEAFHLFEEYNEALPLYRELLKDQPDNSFLHYRKGTCYLNIPSEREKAIIHLEKAITNIDQRNRRPTFRTTRAPLDAIFYLGNAYHLNYRFDDAIEKYTLFMEGMNNSIYDIRVVEENIDASRYAMHITGRPMFFIKENLGERINTRFPEKNPVVSGNEKMLVFTRKLQFYDGIFYSVRSDDGNWSWPVEITPQIGSDGDCYPVSMSWDGNELYIYKSDDLVGNIYFSRFINGKWTPARKLNDNINTRYWESHASISKDGNTLYFTSNRPGGYGGLDIYYSRKTMNGDWGPAVNLGPAINTPYNEETPFITADGQTLYFSSHGHKNMGGYDIFRSSREENGSWSTPVNAGYGINTPGDDLFFQPVRNGIFGYMAKQDTDGFGNSDIFRYEFFSEKNPRKFQLLGVMQRPEGLHATDMARISIADTRTSKTMHHVTPDLKTGEYAVSLETGSWAITFSEEGYEDIRINIELEPDRAESEIRVDALLRPAGDPAQEIAEYSLPGTIAPEAGLPASTKTPELVLSAGTIDPDTGLPAGIAGTSLPATRISSKRDDHSLLDNLTPSRGIPGIDQHYYQASKNDKISISMTLEPNSSLKVEKYLDNISTGADEIVVDRRNFQYDYIPEPGENLLRFTYTDSAGNVAADEVTISFPAYMPADHPDEGYATTDMVHPDFTRQDTLTEEIAEDVPSRDIRERPPHGRIFPLWWILILSILLLAAFYYKKHITGKRNKS